MKPAVMMIVSNKAKAFGILDWSALSSGQVIMMTKQAKTTGSITARASWQAARTTKVNTIAVGPLIT
jgi:hypothetical protein